MEVISDGHGETILLAVICDGMGGLEQGEYASQFMARSFSQWAEAFFDKKENKQNSSEIEAEMLELIRKGNEEIFSYGKEKGISLGTTCSAMMIFQNRYILVHVGDSRFYQIRNGRVTQLTRDHSFVAREVAEGRLTAEAARHDPRRNRLFRCVGGRALVEPESYSGQVDEGDIYFFGSDGLFHELYDEEFRRHLSVYNMKKQPRTDNSLNALISTAISRGETDNTTAGAFYVASDAAEGPWFLRLFHLKANIPTGNVQPDGQENNGKILQKIYLRDEE